MEENDKILKTLDTASNLVSALIGITLASLLHPLIRVYTVWVLVLLSTFMLILGDMYRKRANSIIKSIKEGIDGLIDENHKW